MATNWEALFSDYKGCNFDTISQYVYGVKTEYIEYLENQVEKNIPFLRIKKEFYKKYFPKLIPVAKPKNPSMKELIAQRKAEQKK